MSQPPRVDLFDPSPLSRYCIAAALLGSIAHFSQGMCSVPLRGRIHRRSLRDERFVSWRAMTQRLAPPIPEVMGLSAEHARRHGPAGPRGGCARWSPKRSPRLR